MTLRHRSRFGTPAVLLAALLVRALIPAGYMPGSVADGEFMVMCPVASADTLALLQVDAPHEHHHASSDDAQSIDLACPIGSSLFFAGLPVVESGDLLIPQGERLRDRLVVSSYVAALVQPYPVRAPPKT